MNCKNFYCSLVLILWFSTICSPNFNNILNDITKLGLVNVLQETFRPQGEYALQSLSNIYVL